MTKIFPLVALLTPFLLLKPSFGQKDECDRCVSQGCTYCASNLGHHTSVSNVCVCETNNSSNNSIGVCNRYSPILIEFDTIVECSRLVDDPTYFEETLSPTPGPAVLPLDECLSCVNQGCTYCASIFYDYIANLCDCESSYESYEVCYKHSPLLEDFKSSTNCSGLDRDNDYEDVTFAPSSVPVPGSRQGQCVSCVNEGCMYCGDIYAYGVYEDHCNCENDGICSLFLETFISAADCSSLYAEPRYPTFAPGNYSDYDYDKNFSDFEPLIVFLSVGAPFVICLCCIAANKKAKEDISGAPPAAISNSRTRGRSTVQTVTAIPIGVVPSTGTAGNSANSSSPPLAFATILPADAAQEDSGAPSAPPFVYDIEMCTITVTND